MRKTEIYNPLVTATNISFEGANIYQFLRLSSIKYFVAELQKELTDDDRIMKQNNHCFKIQKVILKKLDQTRKLKVINFKRSLEI